MLLSVSFQLDSHPHHLIHGIIHDITNIRKAEQANIQAQKLAANERLIRILAHEIRNPLNNITLAVEQLKTPSDEEEIQRMAVWPATRESAELEST